MPHPQVLRDMALFVEVAKHRSFSRAALALEIPVSSLSRRITVFETAIGLRLLDRTTRRLTLTSYGEAYFAQAMRLVEEAQQAYDDIVAESKGPSGLLKIAVPADCGTHERIAAIASDFTKSNQHVRLYLGVGHGPADLMDERYDLALALEAPRETSLIVRKVAELAKGIFAAPSYLEDWGRPMSPPDLADHNVLVAGPTSWSFIRGDETASIAVSGQVACNSPNLKRTFALSGHGLFSASLSSVQADLTSGTLEQVMPDWTLQPTPLYIVTTSRLLPAKVRSFIDFAVQRLAAPQSPAGPQSPMSELQGAGSLSR
ncbi:LysR family transcriptional regulator [Methylobacterium sp. Leaf456]|uniref:LysR family transcriptional regulator n=1 Tax=Methylobacterium sp. Leaf456 TaxID=1736382 RepID=UPI0006F52A60|nr:LysR family transcriptional regulator [Methylobacterium sp. Leaf456]KQT51332.1 LysR family transcriptional regulator [Methylobacterium sp. Leaf456]